MTNLLLKNGSLYTVSKDSWTGKSVKTPLSLLNVSPDDRINIMNSIHRSKSGTLVVGRKEIITCKAAAPRIRKLTLKGGREVIQK